MSSMQAIGDVQTAVQCVTHSQILRKDEGLHDMIFHSVIASSAGHTFINMTEHRGSPNDRLKEWVERTNTRLTQVNGQRKYGGPPTDWSGPEPGAGCEIFMCQLPRDVYEDTLIPLCQSVGPLYEFRLMMNFSGQNRGFAYAKYATPAAARAAMHALHRQPLPNMGGSGSTSLVVRLSTEKHQLVLEGLPGELERTALMKVLEELGEGLVALKLKTAVVGPQRERHSTALATYASHHAASMVKKVVVQAFKKQFGVALTVSWTSSTALPTSPDRNDRRPNVSSRGSSRSSSTRPPRLSPPSLSRVAPAPAPAPALPSYTSSHISHSTTQAGHDPSLPPSPASFLPPPLPLPQGLPPVGSLWPDMGSVGSGLLDGPAMNAVANEEQEWRNNPVVILRHLCELLGFGAPQYELLQQNTCADGLLHFVWKVVVPGLPTPPFPVVVHVRPEPQSGVTRVVMQAQAAAATELLQKLLPPPQV